MNATTVKLTDNELEIAILALEYFRRFHLGEYDDESRATVAREVSELETKLRRA